MHIAIDARFLGPEGTGLGRYAESLILALEQLPSEHRFSILLRKENFELYSPANSRFTKVLAPARWYSAKEQIVIPRVLSAIKPDLIHFCHFNVPLILTRNSSPSFIVTIHDVIKSEFYDKGATTRSSSLYALKRFAYQLTMQRAIANAKRVLVPSHYTKKKVQSLFRVNEEHIIVTPEGCNTDQFSQSPTISKQQRKKILQKMGITKPFLLYVGNSYPYKNLQLVLEALPHLPRNLSFVNPCARSVFYDKLKKEVCARGLQRRVVLPGYVSDEVLAVLYSEAMLYVFPSFSEGFGLPVLEAMSLGLPVVASNVSSIPEVGGDAIRYFDPHSLSSFLDAAQDLLEHPEKREAFRVAGYKQAQKYSWKSMAQQTLHAYDSVSNK